MKKNKGITLIALVITIIVMLILVGVTLSITLDENGIIGKTKEAKEKQKKARADEDEAFTIAEGDIDLYTEGTVANKVKIGDYVNYTYDASTEEYPMPTGGTVGGSNTQSFSSAEGEAGEVTSWRVLSKQNGIVKLVAAEPVLSVALQGKTGYLSGPEMLNEICNKLYSKEGIGTARSINIEDINEITLYDGHKTYYDYSGEQIIPTNEKRTLEEAAKTAGEEGTEYDITNFASQVPEEGKNIGDYEINSYSYTGTNEMIFKDIEGNDIGYWIGSSYMKCNMMFGVLDFRITYGTKGRS